MAKHTSVKFSAASVAKGSVVSSKAVEKNFAFESEISCLRHHVSVVSKQLHTVTLERNYLEMLSLELQAQEVMEGVSEPSGDVVAEEVEVTVVRGGVAPTVVAMGIGVTVAPGVASVVNAGEASSVASVEMVDEAPSVASVEVDEVPCVVSVGVVVEVPRCSPVCDDLWKPVPARQRRANVVAAGLGSRDLVGRSSTAVSSSPPLPLLPPKPVLRPVLHARDSSAVTVGRGAGRSGHRTR